MINNKGNIGRVLQDLGSSQQIRSLATSILSAGMIHAMSNMMDLPTKAATLGEHFQDSLLRSSVSVGLSTVIDHEDVKHILEKVATGVLVGTLGGSVANEIGKEWASGNMKSIVHKFAHGFLGATTGAILSKDKLSGALAGALGGVISECVVEMLGEKKLAERVLQEELESAHLEGRTLTQEDYTKSITKALNFKADMGKLASSVTALLMKQDVDITIKTATNAVENNFLPVAIMVGYSVGSALWTAYDIYDTYKTKGPEAALTKAGIDVSVNVLGGVILKGAIKGSLKLTTVAAPTVEAAWFKLVAENPMIFNAVEKIASGVSNATKKVQNKISSFSQGTPLGKGAPKISQGPPEMKITRGKDGKIKGVTNTQDHHIISNKHKATKNHELWEKAEMSPNDKANKMLLPNKRGVEVTTTKRSTHEGRHFGSISKEHAEEMDKIINLGKKEALSPEQYTEKLKILLNEERKALKNGKPLNNLQSVRK